MDIEKEQALGEFASRLNAVCDYMGVPDKGRNRQLAVATLFRVSQKAARKWLEGEGYPTIDKMLRVAAWSGCGVEWLLTGRGDPRPVVASGNGLPETAPDDVRRLASQMAALSPARREALLRIIDLFGA